MENAFKGMENRVSNKIDSVFSLIKEVAERVKKAEERTFRGLNTRLLVCGLVQNHWKLLMEKDDDMENRNRRNNLRIVGLPENEGRDAGGFLEKWLPTLLELDANAPLALERAHRVGPPRRQMVNAAVPPPRTLIMKFLNYRQKEQVLRAAKAKGKLIYKDQSIRFYPDVSAEIHKKQRAYDEVRRRLCDKGINKHRIVFPSRLLLTHREKSTLFDTPAVVERYMEELDKE